MRSQEHFSLKAGFCLHMTRAGWSKWIGRKNRQSTRLYTRLEWIKICFLIH